MISVLTPFEHLYNQLVMEQIGYINNPDLSDVFSALADPTRRGILVQLSRGEASVNELAMPFEMSQPAISKHLKKLETAGLITRRTDRQKRMARLNARPMAQAVSWLEEFRQFWSGSFDQLDDLLNDLQSQTNGLNENE